jgi:hypothetical protein
VRPAAVRRPGQARLRAPELTRVLDSRFDIDHAEQLRQVLDHIDSLKDHINRFVRRPRG